MTTTSGTGDRLPAALRTEALEQLLTERGLIDPKAIDGIITTYETNVGPLNGAKVVAKAWTDPQYRRRLLDDGTAAIKELGFSGSQGEHIDSTIYDKLVPKLRTRRVVTFDSLGYGKSQRS
jgi:nitrile hydratase subunit alpha